MSIKNIKSTLSNTLSTDLFKYEIDNINEDIDSINEIIETHLQDYKKNCELYYQENKSLDKKIFIIKQELDIIKYNEKLLKAVMEYNDSKFEFKFSLLNNELIAIESLPWYKKIFKKIRENAINESVSNTLKNIKPAFDDATNKLNKIINEKPNINDSEEQ